MVFLLENTDPTLGAIYIEYSISITYTLTSLLQYQIGALDTNTPGAPMVPLEIYTLGSGNHYAYFLENVNIFRLAHITSFNIQWETI